MTLFWLDFLRDVVPNHFLSTDVSGLPPELEGRSMWVKRAEMIDVECVARGYISGSGWKDYQRTGAVCGIPLPAGLRESDALPEPIFTPATKAQTGHDENISFEQRRRTDRRGSGGAAARSDARDLQTRRRIRARRAASSSPTRNSNSAWSTAKLFWPTRC